ASGPLVGSQPPSALLLMRADSSDAIEALLDDDPFHTAGLIAERRVDEWNPVIGIFAEQAG
ncbi:MAG TPA: YciI family protein, partial [Tessaracoccus flavescens]|nr:YciI family protein [Tessaracoccus flavescens]